MLDVACPVSDWAVFHACTPRQCACAGRYISALEGSPTLLAESGSDGYAAAKLVTEKHESKVAKTAADKELRDAEEALDSARASFESADAEAKDAYRRQLERGRAETDVLKKARQQKLKRMRDGPDGGRATSRRAVASAKKATKSLAAETHTAMWAEKVEAEEKRLSFCTEQGWVKPQAIHAKGNTVVGSLAGGAVGAGYAADVFATTPRGVPAVLAKPAAVPGVLAVRVTGVDGSVTLQPVRAIWGDKVVTTGPDGEPAHHSRAGAGSLDWPLDAPEHDAHEAGGAPLTPVSGQRKLPGRRPNEDGLRVPAAQPSDRGASKPRAKGVCRARAHPRVERARARTCRLHACTGTPALMLVLVPAPVLALVPAVSSARTHVSFACVHWCWCQCQCQCWCWRLVCCHACMRTRRPASRLTLWCGCATPLAWAPRCEEACQRAHR